MYNIDSFIDIVIDDFSEHIKKIKITFDEHKKINELLKNYISNLDINEIRKNFESNEVINLILNVIKKYILIFFLLYIGFSLSTEKFTTELFKLMKLMDGSGYDIENFYNSSSYAEIIKNFSLMKSTYYTLYEKNKLHDEIGKNFIKELNHEYVVRLSKIKNFQSKIFNVIKSVIIMSSYKNDRPPLIKKIEQNIYNKGEYIYIDVIYPIKSVIDSEIIKSILTTDEIEKGIGDQIWYFLTEEIFDDFTGTNDKINRFMNSNAIIPIVDDFLLYHKDSEQYEQQKIEKVKDISQLQFIINKLDKVSNYYDEPDNKVFYSPLISRNAVLINEEKEAKIINKLINIGRRVIEGNNLYTELLHYRKYPYNNFRKTRNNEFIYVPTKTLNMLRYCVIEKSKNPNDLIEWRVGTPNDYVNIIGFMFNPKYFQCIKLNTIQNIKFGKKKGKKNYYIIFDIGQTENIDISSNQETIKNNINNLFEIYLSNFSKKVIEKLENKQLSFDKALSVIEYFEKKFKLIIPKNSDFYYELELYIFQNVLIKKKEIHDPIEDIFFGLTDDVIKLPEKTSSKISTSIKKKSLFSEKFSGKKKEKYDLPENVLCQHYPSWDYIMSLRRKDPHKYEELLFNFLNQYIIESEEGDFICKSCGSLINYRRYVIDGIFDIETHRFISYGTTIDIPLEEIKEYERYSNVIRNIDKIIEKMAEIINIPNYIGFGTSPAVRTRKILTKNVMDIILANNKLLKGKNRKQNNMSKLFIFDLDNNVFTYTSGEKDYYKSIKVNNIIIYIAICLLLDINETQITSFVNDNKTICNFSAFEKLGKKLFKDGYIIINKTGENDLILNYELFCYMIYIFSCMMTKYNLWLEKEKTSKKIDVNIQKTIIYTLVDVLNSILEFGNMKNIPNIYQILYGKYYSKLNSFYNNINIIKQFISDENKKKREHYLIIKSKHSGIPLTGFFIHSEPIIPKYICAKMSNINVKRKKEIDNILYNISNVTNCKDTANFHDWKLDNDKFICSECKISNVKFDEKETKKILEKYLQKKTKKLHKKINLYEAVLKEDKKFKDISNIKNETNEFIKLMKSIIGVETQYNENTTLIDKDIFVIYYSHTGNKLNDPIIIDDMICKDGMYKYKISNIEVFYDERTNIFSGYKDVKFIKNNNTNIKLKINYSIINKLKYLGYEYFYYDITDDIRNNYDKKLKEIMISKIINEIISKKIINVNKFIGELIKSLNKFKKDNDVDTSNLFVERNIHLENDVIKINNKNEEYINVKNIESKNINLMYNFIISELYNFIKNNNKNVCLNIIKNINDFFNETNDEIKINEDFDLKKFNYIIKSSTMFISEYDYTGETKGIYDEYYDKSEMTKEEIEQEEEEKEDDIETENAVDIEENQDDADDGEGNN